MGAILAVSRCAQRACVPNVLVCGCMVCPCLPLETEEVELPCSESREKRYKTFSSCSAPPFGTSNWRPQYPGGGAGRMHTFASLFLSDKREYLVLYKPAWYRLAAFPAPWVLVLIILIVDF